MYAILLLVPIFIFSSCAYTFQARGNPWKDQGIERVQIRTLQNNSLKPGAENVFTSALLKEFSRGARLRLASDSQDADAFLEGTIDSITNGISSSTTVPQIAQNDPDAKQFFSDVTIATEYSTAAQITVRLVRKRDRAVVWTQSFAQNKLYPGNNRFGLLGDTSMQINSSEQDLALYEIARNLANDAYDAVLEAF